MQYIRIYTISLGCPKNLVDTENLLGSIGKYYLPVSDPKKSDVILINTCAFIQDAVEESIETILEVCESVKHIPTPPFIIVTGCLVERYTREVLSKEIPEVDLFLPIHAQNEFPKIISSLFKNKLSTHSYNPLNRIITTGKSYAYIKISEGCNHSCSFCIIPKLRGRLSSIPKDILIKEAKSIIDQDIKELILVAQDTTSYGMDKGEKYGLISLLDSLCSIHGIKWLRLLYLYPKGVDKELLKFLKSISPPFIPYFDIPLQHSHPEILKKMGRPFQIQGEKIIDLIRKYFPDAAIRTTFIVGFPGEKEHHFNHLKRFIEDTEFTHVGVFSYFPEQESASSKLSEQVPEAIKQERKNILMNIQRTISKKFLSSFKDKEMEIIIDKKSEEWATLYEGRVWLQAPEIDGKTYISGEGLSEGQVIVGKILDTYEYDLSGLI